MGRVEIKQPILCDFLAGMREKICIILRHEKEGEKVVLVEGKCTEVSWVEGILSVACIVPQNQQDHGQDPRLPDIDIIMGDVCPNSMPQ
jgi:hypothetical protein